MLLQDNPLLDFSGLPQFEKIKPEHVAPAIEQLLADGRATTAAALNAKPTWDEFVGPLETRTSASAARGARSRTCTR